MKGGEGEAVGDWDWDWDWDEEEGGGGGGGGGTEKKIPIVGGYSDIKYILYNTCITHIYNHFVVQISVELTTNLKKMQLRRSSAKIILYNWKGGGVNKQKINKLYLKKILWSNNKDKNNIESKMSREPPPPHHIRWLNF